MRLFSYIFLFLLTTWQLIAQTYPVQVVPVLTPPYSSKIADYANPMANKVQLQLITTDLSVQNRPVQLYVEIKGNGLTAASAPVLSGVSPLRISGGEILRLTNAELASYFQLRNLQGITSQQYASALPDGMYSFCFRVKDVLSGRWLSQSHCAIAYLMLNDPPILNIPSDNEQVAVTDFQNIIFSWTPRQINATNVTYSFELREILDPTLDPRFAFEVSRHILKEDDLRMTTFVYDVSKPNLIPGRRYAWRVRAISTGGLAENSVFKNDGYSEVHTFVYAVNCSKPLFLLSEQQGRSRTKLLWQGHTLHQKYHIQYRKKNVEGAQWFETFTRNTQTLIADLEAGEYEFRVGASCEGERYGITPSYVYSDIQTFKIEKTPNTTEQGYNCGIVPKITITNQKPLNSLITNEVFTAGDFAVTLLEVSGSNGVFSGKGFIKVPYLNDTKLAVEFENVKINSDYQLTDGVVKTTYDADWKNVQFIENLTGQGKKSNEINVPFEIDKVETRNGEIVVTGKDGRKEVFPFGGNDSTVKGKVTTTTNGVTSTQEKIYHIDKDGKVSEPQTVAQGGKPTKENTNGVSKGGEATALTAKGIEVTFENTADSKYAYEVPTKAYSKDYQKLDGKYIPFKAVVKGETEPFLAKVQITDKNISTDSLIFKTDKGALIESKRVEGSNDFLLTLKGFHSFAVEQVQATIKQGKKYQIAGVFNLVHLSPKTAKVILVPTSENISMDIDRVKSIYSKIGVTLDITWAAPFDITPYLTNGSLETNDVFGDLTDYSPSQQAIINAYKATGKVANDTYYVFITNAKSSTGQAGYMALGGQFGFVFDSTARTLAHELGHGIFKLEHPFKGKNADKGKTTALMDYNEGQDFFYRDWKQINDPKVKLYAFQGQSEGEFGGKIWLTPDWRPFKYDRSHTTAIDREELSEIPQGALPAILGEDKKAYYAEFSNEKFVGYKNLDGLFLKLDYQTSINDKTEIYLYRTGNFCGSDTYYKTSWGYIKDKKGTVSFTGTPITFVNTIACRKENSIDSPCDNFRVIKTSDLAEYQKDLKEYLANAIKKITTSRKKEVVAVGQYNHIVNNFVTNVPEKQLYELEEKLHLLSYYTKIDVVLTFLPLRKNSYIPEHILSDLAQKAIEGVSGNKSDRKLVYLVVASSEYESIFKEGTIKKLNCHTISFAQTDNSIIRSKYKGNSIFEKLLTLYQDIPKPLIMNKYYQYADGSVRNYTYKSKENLRGYPFIKKLTFYQSKEFRRNKYCVYTSDYPELYQNCENKNRKALIKSLKAEYAQDGLKNKALWEEVDIHQLGRFREVYMDYGIDKTPNYPLYLWQNSVDTWQFKNKVKIALEKGTLPPEVFYDFEKLKVLDGAVYGTLDIISLIPGADIFTDPLCAAYASARNDATNLTIYSAGAILPLASGAYIRGGAKALNEEIMVAVAKKADNGEVELVYKNINDIAPNELYIATTIDNKQTQAFLDETKKQLDLYSINTQLDNLGKTGKQIANLAEDLSKKTNNILTKAFSEGSKFIDDKKTIEKITHYLAPENAEKLKAIGGESGLKNFLAKYKDAPCGNCKDAGRQIFGGRTIDEMLENYVEAAHTFRNRPDLWKKIEEGALSSNAAMREGTQHMLSTFKKNPKKYTPENIEHLDMKFEKGSDAVCANCRYDVKFNTNRNEGLPLFEEFKSYNTETWSKIANDKGFIKQFESYLQEVDEIKDLAYMINSNKANINEVKQAFKELFKRNSDEILEIMSPELKKSLGLIKKDKEEVFKLLIKDTNSPLYNFIKSQ